MLEKAPKALGHALEAVRAGPDKLIWADSGTEAPQTIEVLSEAFADSAPIPARFTEDGDKISPPLSWNGVPATAASVILVVEDADSPTPSPIVHCLAYDLPGSDFQLAEGALSGDEAVFCLGRNSFRRTGYLPPDPPPGHGPHRYVFQVYALNVRPDLPDPPNKGDVVAALRGHVIARGRLMGTYRRP